ncbi:MAG TPA: hypothetical protein VND64_14805 [Pirellulales bacterium]|nr:hypothetical protein [Pirellulales bacterium]
METVVRNVRELDQTDRSALERVVGHELRENQRLVIQVMSVTIEKPPPALPANGKLPPWCDVYEGLPDAEIDDLDRAIVRTHSSRDIQ